MSRLNIILTGFMGTGRVFCLVATPEPIFKRVTADNEARRPLLDTTNPLQRIVKLIKEREGGYKQFTQILTSGKNPQAITQDLIRLFKKS